MCLLLSPLFNIALEVLAKAIQIEKEIIVIQTGGKNKQTNKEVQFLLFADYMTLCIENAKDATRQLLELINEYGTVTRHKINTQKYLAFLSLAMKNQKKKLRKQYHSPLHQKE